MNQNARWNFQYTSYLTCHIISHIYAPFLFNFSSISEDKNRQYSLHANTRSVVEQVECVWNLMAHGDAREGKWRGNWRMEWVAITLTLPRNVVYPALLPLMPTPRLPAVDWTDAPADLNGLVRFGERRNLVSARVPSHFKRTIQTDPDPFRHVKHSRSATATDGTETWRRRSCQCKHLRLITHEKVLLNGDVPRRNGNVMCSVNRP